MIEYVDIPDFFQITSPKTVPMVLLVTCKKDRRDGEISSTIFFYQKGISLVYIRALLMITINILLIKDAWRPKKRSYNGKKKNHGHIRDQQDEIHKNQCCIFKFMSFWFLTFFSTTVFIGSLKLRQIQIKSKHRKTINLSKSQLQEKCMDIVAVNVQYMVSAEFWPLFLTEKTVKTTNNAYMRDEQVEIYLNKCFVFKSSSFQFLTGFSTAVFTRSWRIRSMKINSKHKKPLDVSNSKYE